MAKEYTHRHGRRKRRKKRKKSKKKQSKGARAAPAAPAFRKRRSYAARPRRAPSGVLQERTTQAMRVELARQLLGPRYPGPNKITQQGPPFLPYDPWAEQRRGIQRQEDQRMEQLTRIARQAARDEAAGIPEDEELPEPGRSGAVPQQVLVARHARAVLCARGAGRPGTPANVPRIHCAIRTLSSFLISSSR